MIPDIVELLLRRTRYETAPGAMPTALRGHAEQTQFSCSPKAVGMAPGVGFGQPPQSHLYGKNVCGGQSSGFSFCQPKNSCKRFFSAMSVTNSVNDPATARAVPRRVT